MISRKWMAPASLALIAVCLAQQLWGQTSPSSMTASTSMMASGLAVSGQRSLVGTPEFSSAQQAGPNRLRGALLGGGIGLVAGGILGGLSVQSETDDGFGGSTIGEGAATATAVALGALLGGGIGAALGATVFAPSRNVNAQAIRSGRLRLGFSWGI